MGLSRSDTCHPTIIKTVKFNPAVSDLYLLLHYDVQDAPDHAPGVVHVQVNLLTELHWLELLGAEYDVAGTVLHAVSSHIPEFEVVSPG